MPSALISVVALVVSVAPGCLFAPGREGLEDLLSGRRGEPHGVTRFSREPRDGSLPVEELRETLAYWNAVAGGVPRWRGVLQPSSDDLYSRLLDHVDGGGDLKLVAYRYDAIGHDDVTLVEYFDESGRLLGRDHVPYEKRESRDSSRRAVGYWNLAWWEYPMMLLDIPVYLAIGMKEFAGEAVKSPLAALSAGWIGPSLEGRHPLSPVCFSRAARAFVENWKYGWTALTWRFRVRTRHTPLDLARDLAGAVPVVGPLVGHRSPHEDAAPTSATSVIAVSQGIHIGVDQFDRAWRNAASAVRPEVVVTSTPYRFGGFQDPLWSILNLSHGFAYEQARQLVFDEGVGPGDSVEILGFSGGAQRAAAASLALRSAGVTVRRIVGVAGPVGGNSSAIDSSVLLGKVADDPVVLMARLVNAIQIFVPTNVRTGFVPEAGGHHFPYFPHGLTRAPNLGYARRLEDLLRPAGEGTLPRDEEPDAEATPTGEES